jgi:hypothetical protein
MGNYRTFGTALDRVFRNDLNNNFKDIATDINAQKTRVDNLITGTPQPSEVVDARGGKAVLKDRLDAVDASLANNSVGIKIVTSDCLVDGAILLDFHTGFWSVGSNYFENVHCWKSRNFNGSIGFRQENGVAWLDNCYLDSYQYSIYKETQTQLFITNLRTFFNTALYTNAYNTPTILYSTNTAIDMFSFTSLTNSFIKSGVVGTALSNYANLIVKEKNNSYDYGEFTGVTNMNRKDVTLGSGVVKGNFDNFCKFNDNTTTLRLNMNCATGFVHNQRIGTVFSKPAQPVYVPCIVSDNAWVGSSTDAATANNGVVVIDDTGGIYYYNLSGVPSRKYLFLTTTYNTRML